ncbi:hypothetical protein ACJMK2_006348 [Sinanodonta woodiana]|uniref:BPTI/Kunitz inhibitor domain-containing protein n=1 Tax=Sinanodonta woodiana TaxID=1069815 RepID=A0ABD3VT24_SINWO
MKYQTLSFLCFLILYVELSQAVIPFLPPNIKRCLKPQDPGPCHPIHLRWYYNSITRRCETFLYGGCLGNDNNFVTLWQCIQACGILSG